MPKIYDDELYATRDLFAVWLFCKECLFARRIAVLQGVFQGNQQDGRGFGCFASIISKDLAVLQGGLLICKEYSRQSADWQRFGWHYLSNATCLTPLLEFPALFTTDEENMR